MDTDAAAAAVLKFTNEVYETVDDYNKSWSIAMPLRALNRRFGVRSKRLTGLTTLEFLKSKPELFMIQLARSGGTDIMAL